MDIESASEDRGESVEGVGLGEDDEGHDERAEDFDEAFEGDEGILGPDDTERHESEESDEGSIGAESWAPGEVAFGEDTEAEEGEGEEEIAIDGAAFGGVGGVIGDGDAPELAPIADGMRGDDEIPEGGEEEVLGMGIIAGAIGAESGVDEDEAQSEGEVRRQVARGLGVEFGELGDDLEVEAFVTFGEGGEAEMGFDGEASVGGEGESEGGRREERGEGSGEFGEISCGDEEASFTGDDGIGDPARGVSDYGSFHGLSFEDDASEAFVVIGGESDDGGGGIPIAEESGGEIAEEMDEGGEAGLGDGLGEFGGEGGVIDATGEGEGGGDAGAVEGSEGVDEIELAFFADDYGGEEDERGGGRSGEWLGERALEEGGIDAIGEIDEAGLEVVGDLEGIDASDAVGEEGMFADGEVEEAIVGVVIEEGDWEVSEEGFGEDGLGIGAAEEVEDEEILGG